MNEPFVEMLRGATNTLGRTEEVATLVLDSPSRAQELYDCFFQPDEWVRMRTASVSKRVWRAKPELFSPFIQSWVDDVSAIDQASTRWTFAQMCEECNGLLTDEQRDQCIEIVATYLETQTDWMVLNSSMPPLAMWAKDSPALEQRIRPHLERLSHDERKSVAKRAAKALSRLLD